MKSKKSPIQNSRFDVKNVCYLCGRVTECDRHHVFNGPMRNKSEEYGAVVYLCRICHGRIHNGKDELSIRMRKNLKAIIQRALMVENGWTVDEFREVFKKNYLNGDEEDD